MSDEPSTLTSLSPKSVARHARWLVWLVGSAACATLILVVTHLSEEKEMLRLLQQIEPIWLLLALALQSCTYLAQGFIWRAAAAAAGHRLPMAKAFEMSLAMLFINQALPSGGISGMALISGAVARIGMPRAVVVSAVLVDVSMYYLSYAACMATALAIAMHHDILPGWLLALMGGFVAVGLGITWLVLTLARNRPGRPLSRLRRFGPAAKILDWVDEARPASTQQPRVQLQAFACHVAIFLLDAATLWVAARSLGASPGMEAVFASFMVSTLFRTLGVMPGGLGTFETASVMTLKSIGLPLSVGLSATLLFRGLSFWLPMLPGLACSRRMLKHPSATKIGGAFTTPSTNGQTDDASPAR